MSKWISPTPPACDLCGREIERTQSDFVDGRTHSGVWAIFCIPCHGMYGVGLGTGKGQKYDGKTLKKVAG